MVVVILAHNRSEILSNILETWKDVDGIGHTLFIISHDGYFPDVHEVIRTFQQKLRIRQIYFPDSAHVLRDVFPAGKHYITL